MANIVDFYKDEDCSFVYKCNVRGKICVAQFEEMKLCLEKRKHGDAEKSALLHFKKQTEAQGLTENRSV